jgi:hypothetical protein
MTDKAVDTIGNQTPIALKDAAVPLIQDAGRHGQSYEQCPAFNAACRPNVESLKRHSFRMGFADMLTLQCTRDDSNVEVRKVTGGSGDLAVVEVPQLVTVFSKLFVRNVWMSLFCE